MQPEKTSQPMGGEYDNQLMLIKTLADSVPEGWKVYVKEHPNQFNVRKVPNRHYRDKLFYACLQELKNVELVPLEIDSEDLIQSSKMVATLTGTLGWEAITKNIPALVFGNTYYMACRAARKITSVATCKLAIEELSNMNDKDFEKEIIRYISYYHEQNWIIQTANWQTNFAINSLSYNDQINNIVDRLSYFHNKKQG
jgi:capsule polysaccharide export protein KpsC/LpsZ